MLQRQRPFLWTELHHLEKIKLPSQHVECHSTITVKGHRLMGEAGNASQLVHLVENTAVIVVVVPKSHELFRTERNSVTDLGVRGPS